MGSELTGPSDNILTIHVGSQFASVGQGKRTFYEKWSVTIVCLTLLMVPCAFYGAGQAVQSNVNRVEDWLPSSFAETKNLAWFRKNFASDQFIIVSWEGCRLGFAAQGTQDDPRLQHLAGLLVPTDLASRTSTEAADRTRLNELRPDDRAACDRYFKSIVTGRDLLNRLTSPPLNLSSAEAVRRLEGTMVGPDGQQTCSVVTLKPAALRELKLVLGTGQQRIFRENVPPGVLRRLLAQVGVPAEHLHMGGPPIDNSAIDEEGERTLIRLAGLSGLLGLGLAWWALRSVLLTAIVFSCGVVSAATSLAIVWLTGQHLDAILMSMPSLVYVLAISGAVHLVNYYREAIENGGLRGAVESAVAHAWKPAVLCSITTAVGLVSLSASELVPIRKFGIYSAAGVMGLVAIVYFFLPAALQLSGVGKRWIPKTKHVKKDPPSSPPKAPAGVTFWEHIASCLVNHYRLVGTLCIAITVSVGLGLQYTSSSIDLLKLFDSRARILQDYRWLEANLGKLVPLEIVVRFPTETQLELQNNQGQTDQWQSLSFVQRLETVTRMQSLIDRKFGPTGENLVGRSMSAASFAPRLPAAQSGNYAFIQRKAIDTIMRKSRTDLSDAGFLKVDPSDGSELWRVSLRVAAFRNVDYGQFVKDLEQITQPLLDAYHTRAEVLNELSRTLPDDSGDKRKVLLWGYHDVGDASDAALHDTAISDKAFNEEASKTFQWILRSLLEESRCAVELVTSDPQTTPLSTMESMRGFDMAVLVGDFADADLDVVRAAIPRTFDARLAGAYVSGESMSNKRMSGERMAGEPARSSRDDSQRVKAIYTGVVPIVYQAQRALLNSLVESTWWSFLTITPIMMLVSRGFLAGCIAMLPNAVPVLLIFGGMGWLGIPLDIGSMMTASIALGVAVDDTIHFLARYRDSLELYGDRKTAIVATYGSSAIPTLQAALISGLGLSVFAFSTFTPTQRFGWLMLCILLAGVVSELILLPALLASPLGRVFTVKKKPQQPEGGVTHPGEPIALETSDQYRSAA